MTLGLTEGRPTDPLLRSPERLQGFALPLASTEDLLCMKLSTIAGRGARRDFWDLHALLLSLNYGLEQTLALYVQKDPVENVGYMLKTRHGSERLSGFELAARFGDFFREAFFVG